MKKTMQNVSFQTKEELFRFLPEDQLETVQRLRELVYECIPDIKEKLSFNVPFFRKRKSICFIWPGAVSWGAKTWEGVEFGFNHGYLLADEMNYLDRGSRKQVYSKRFFSGSEIHEDIIRSYLFEATELDEIMYQEKLRK